MVITTINIAPFFAAHVSINCSPRLQFIINTRTIETVKTVFCFELGSCCKTRTPSGGSGTSLCKLQSCVQLKGMVGIHFGLKTGIDFNHLDGKLFMVNAFWSRPGHGLSKELRDYISIFTSLSSNEIYREKEGNKRR